jgi:hypothetical protein
MNCPCSDDCHQWSFWFKVWVISDATVDAGSGDFCAFVWQGNSNFTIKESDLSL